ncbi:hypothetical protein TNCV_4711821 [Trichonephila clavipes]|nr:hypothetical protein TNCV_4711821 [Trichonephila clavipes]
MVAWGNRCQNTSTAGCRSSTVCVNGSSVHVTSKRSQRSHACSIGFRSGEFTGRGRISNPIRMLRVLRSCNIRSWHCHAGVKCWVRPAARAKQEAPQHVWHSGSLSKGRHRVPEASCDQTLCHSEP